MSKAESIAKSVETISNSRGLEAVGNGLGTGLAALAGAIVLTSFLFGIAAVTKWDGRLHSQLHCF